MPFFLCIISELVTFVKCKNLQNLITMKKNIILLLVSLLLSLGAAQATDFVKCYGSKVTFEASQTGDSYQWYKDGSPISGATQKTLTINKVEKSAKYECKISTSGTTFDTGNLITEGSFAKSCSNTVNYGKVTNSQNNNVQYELMNLQCSVNDYTSPGFTTIVKNSTDAKPTFFEPLASASNKGDFFLVCDGSSSSGVRIWQARDISLKAGVTYQFSCMVANVDKNTATNGSNSLSNLEFRIEYDGNYGDGDLLMAFKAPATPGKWEQQSTTFTPKKDLNYCHIHIRNHNVLSAGNDFALDDIYFGTEITTAGSSTTETFNLTVYDTFTYEFKTDEVCPGEQATITTTLKPAHGGTLEPASNYKYEWKVNGTAPVVSSQKDLVVTAPNTVGTLSYVLSTSSTVCYSSAANSETTSVKTKDCGRTETINHPAVTVCTNQNVTLKCDKTGNSVTWNDPSLTGTEVTVTSSSSVGAEDKYTCTIITTENGYTVTYIENFTVKTKDCSITIESTMCNNAADSTLKASKTGTNYEYHWTLPNGITRITETDTIQIRPTNANVGEVLEYSCEIYEVPVSNPAPNAPIAGRSPMLLGTDNFEITIRDCIVETDDEEDLQTKEDGSITLIVPEANRCDGCKYYWYKRNEDGAKGEAVAKNAGEEDWEHTVYNATADGYMCEIIAPNGNKHTQTYKISVYTPKTSTYCFTEDSKEDQKKTITLTEGNRNEYEWYWRKDNQDIPFPEGSISTEENNITLDLAYFVNNSNSNFPVKVHIIEKYAHKIETTTETPGGNTGTNMGPAPIAPAPVTPPTSTSIPNVNINSSSLTMTNMSQVNDSTFTYEYKITDDTQGVNEITVADKFVVSKNYKYNDTFPPKTASMTSHEGMVRLTNIGINGCSAYKVDDPNNEYFIEVDGGDKQGPVFSIKQPGKLIKGEKYILRFLARETSTIAGNPKTTSPAKIDFSITYGDKRDALTNVQTIDTQDWNAYVFTYIAKHDCEDVIITLSNYNTESGYNDFAIDEITFTLADEGNNSAKRNATALNNDDVIDEDGDGFVMWKDEHIVTIYPNTTQTITEVSGPNQEYEKEVALPMGEKITFRYDPSTYTDGMTKYEANDYRTDEYGCNHSVYFTLNLISIEPMIFFSPNNDGVNDLWLVEGIETAPNAYIRIYDRYSKLLYQCKGADFKGWDGNYNGHGMVQDDYWYVISIPETEEQISGHFTLKR